MSRAAGAPPRALIVGGSLAGLSAAAWLARSGFTVVVLERAPRQLEGFGAGIVLHPSTIRYLTEYEGLSPDAIGLGVDHLRYIGAGGEVLAESASRLRFTSYGLLYRRLREAAERAGARYLAGAAVASVGCDRRSAWADLVTGGRRHGEVVVGADGAISYSILDRSHLLTYPIADAAGRRVLRNWVWYRNVTTRYDLEELRRDRRGVLRDLSVPAGAVAAVAIARLRRDAAEALPGPLAAVVRRTPAPFLQVVVDVTPASLAQGRVCVLGDAGFVARPHAAAGTAKAAEEARLLAGALDRCPDIAAALVSWEAEALPLGRDLVARAREAGERAQHEGTWQPGEPLPFGLRRVGDSESW